MSNSVFYDEPIRILHVIGSLNIGGSQTMIKSIYRVIDRQKIQFDFIIDHPDEVELAPELLELGARIYTMPTFKGFNYFECYHAWDSFFSEHPEYNFLHSHVRSYASLYIPIAKRHGLKTIIHAHSTSNGKGIISLIKKCLQFPLRYQADYCLACSEEAGIWLYGRKNISKDNFYIVKNGIECNRYVFNKEKRMNYRNDFNINDKIVFMNVGRFHFAKNHKFLLEVFNEIRLRQSNAFLVLVGDGELRDSIKEKINELQMEDYVLMLGNRGDVNHLLQMADCFLFPSLWEGLGIVAIEAQAAGLPVLCSDKIPPEVSITEICKFLPINNINIWVESALSIIHNERKDMRQYIIKAGYDISSTAKWLCELYTS